MDECAKRIPAELSSHVLQSNPSSDVPDVSWIRERDATSRVSRRFIEEPLVFRITTDDPVQRDDIGGKNLTGQASSGAIACEFPTPANDSVTVPGSFESSLAS